MKRIFFVVVLIGCNLGLFGQKYAFDWGVIADSSGNLYLHSTAVIDSFHPDAFRLTPAEFHGKKGYISRTGLIEKRRKTGVDRYSILAEKKDAGDLYRGDFIFPFPSLKDSVCFWRVAE